MPRVIRVLADACKSNVGSYTYNYSSQPHAVLSAGNITMQYNANSNISPEGRVQRGHLKLHVQPGQHARLHIKERGQQLSYLYL